MGRDGENDSQVKKIKQIDSYLISGLKTIEINIKLIQQISIKKMGQGQLQSGNEVYRNWAPHPTEPNTYINIQTKQQAESYLVSLSKLQQSSLSKRVQQTNNFLAKILYVESPGIPKSPKEDPKFYVFTEKTYPISRSNWVPVTFPLSILKGFRRLSSSHGMMRVTPHMIKVNISNQIRVWTNENPAKIQPFIKAESQQQMLADIVKIIMEFDGTTGALMMKCQSINEAINNILHNMTDSKNQPNFSNRTSKNQDKPKNSSKDTFNALPSKINNIRSTKETEDDSLKPFNEITLKYNPKKEPSLTSVQSPKNYMQNVTVPKLPTYINVDRPDNQPKAYLYGGLKGTDSDHGGSRDLNYSQQNNMQKQSSIQFNNSHPAKMVSTGRPFKPVQHKNQNFSQSLNNQPTQFNPTYQRPGRDPEKYSSKYVDILNKAQQFVVYPERKSNLNKNYLERIQTSQESLQGSDQRTKGSFGNERSEINTSRQFMQSHSFTRPRFEATGYFQSGRTKTQEFYSVNNDMIGNSPRIRTNYLQSNTSQIPKSIMQSNKIVYNPTQNPQSGVSRIIESPKVIEVQRVKIDQVSDADEKKQIKLKQAQKIKQEMGILGIQNDGAKTLTNDKSARDILIKQKIEQKNKKHEQLKFAITRLLSE